MFCYRKATLEDLETIWNRSIAENPEDTGMTIFADYMEELSGGKPAIVTTEETIELTNACLKAQEAADTGKIIYF